jgi:hypothetical protein
MSTPKTIKRLVTCFGSIQLVTVLSVLSYRESQQPVNLNYENYLVITPLFAPQGQNAEFVTFIEKMAKSICSWEKIVYISLEQKNSLAKKIKWFGLSRISSMVCELTGLKNADELYLSHEYNFEDQLLMNVYESAEKICYGNGIGIYNSQSVFPRPSSLKNTYSYLNYLYTSLKEKVKLLFPQKDLLSKKQFDMGYFSLPSALGEVPPMEKIILDKSVYLETFQKLRKQLGILIDIDYINNLRSKLQEAPTSILLTSNFSEAAGRMSLENEISAYREFLETQGILRNSILLIKPHPRDAKLKILKLKSALSDLYSDIILLSEDFLFYLPFEVFFMEIFLNPDLPKLQIPRIFTFSSACLTLELILNAQCFLGFGSDIVKKFFYQDHVFSRIKHEADLLSTIREIKHLNTSVV